MAIQYTRAEIRTRVNDAIRDPGNGKHSEAKKNRVISDVCRDFVGRTFCNRNVVVFSVATSVANGVLEYDRNGHAPTLTLVDVEGQPHYQLSGCDRIAKVRRWIGATTEWEGWATSFLPANEDVIDDYGLEGFTQGDSEFYQMLDAPDTFRLLPPLAATDFPIKIGIRYYEAGVDMASDDRMPTDTSDPVMTTGLGLNDMNLHAVATTYGRWDFEVMVGGSTNPNTYRYRKDGGAWSTAPYFAMTTTEAPQTLPNETLAISWDAVIGHTAGNIWTIWQDDLRVPSIPLLWRPVVISGVIAQLLLRDDDERANVYQMLYENYVAKYLESGKRDTSDARPVRLRQTYLGAG